MSHDQYDDDLIASILTNTRTIAMVGASRNPLRPSYGVLQFLLAHNYRVLPVNPGLAVRGADAPLLGAMVYARLGDIAEPIDMVDIFRRSEAAGAILDEALNLAIKPRVIWMQLGVRDDAAAARAEAQGVTVIMNRCPAIEYHRLIING